MIKVREMNENDIPKILSFFKDTDENFLYQWGGLKSYKYPLSADQIQNRMKDSYTTKKTLFYVVTKDEDIIGTYELDFIDWNKKECLFCKFLIDKNYRSKGYGKETLKAAFENASQTLGLKILRLNVFDFNKGALNCYLDSGLKEISRTKRDNGWTAIKMEKIL